MLENMALNSKLLTAKGSPLKIYLDGFDISDFLEISSLIDTYGGELANADNSNIVLSAPSHPPGTKYRRFHINWLYDSINNCKLQDIAKYLIPPGALQNDAMVLQEDSDASSEEPRIKALEWRKEDTENDPPNVPSTSNDTPIKKRANSTDGSTQAQDDSENQEPPRDENDGGREHAAKKSRQSNSARTRTRLSTENTKENRQSSGPSGRKALKSPNKKWSSEEDQKIIQFFIDKKDTIIQIPNVYRQMEASMNFLQPFRSADALRHRITNYIIPNLQQLTDDPKVLKAFEEISTKRRSTASST